MPRSVRHEYGGAVYHAMCRGNNGQAIFRQDKGRRLFLSTLEEACRQTGWRIHAYVLMPNHYHLLLETPEANLVAGMKWFQGTYTQRFNAMFKCRGHLFQGRYKALPVEAEGNADYFRAVGNYIHLNPYRSGLAGNGFGKSLEAYKWSSYGAYAGLSGRCPDWLFRERLMNACGIDGKKPDCFKQYRAVLETQMEGSSGVLDKMVEKQLKRGWYVGGEQFKEWLGGMLPDRSDNLRGGQRRAHDEKEAERLLAAALDRLKINETDLLAMKNNQPEKQSVAWLLKKFTTVTGVWITSRINMGHRSNLSRALSALERNPDRIRKNLKQEMIQCTG
ncbi:MAG: transposase [Verrucomicrobiota bacterium]